jgi:hypothetical protein
MVKVECIVTYNDLQLERLVKIGEELEVTKDRADTLVEKGLAKVIEVIPEPKVEQPKVEEETITVTKKSKKKK